MKKVLIALSAFSLASCTTVDRLVTAPAPLATTVIDERTFIIALQTFDTVLTSIDRLIEAGVIKPGSPRAIQIADAIRSAKLAYQAASAAQRAGNSSNYLAALAQARTALASINLLVKGS